MRNLGQKILMVALLAVCSVAAAPAADLVGTVDSRLGTPLSNELVVGALIAGASVDSTFYECRPQHYNPPCMKISRAVDSTGAQVLVRSATVADYLQLRAAIDTMAYLTPVAVGTSFTDPIEACSNTTHGASGCCRIVDTREDSTGTVYIIECGTR